MNNTTKSRTWQQLKFSDRQKIEVLRKAKHAAKEIAAILGYSKRTVERELNRGKIATKRIRPNPYAAVIPTLRSYDIVYEYSAEVSQQAHELNSTAKGKQLKLGKNYAFCEKLGDYIKAQYSPYSALQLLKHTNEHCLSICVRTLYSYIAKGYIPGITNADLPEQGKPRKRGYKPVRLALNNLKGRSIEERPPEVAVRTTFGHWEFDCVEGKAGTKEVLLVMSERLTRHELIFKLPSKKQKEVLKVLDGLEERYGTEQFRRIFKTATCDNGCEFLDQKGLEKSIYGGERLQVYYCHPYSAYERGTNENINRMLRRHIPKGTPISNYTPAEIQKIQDRINSTPRLVLEGYPSNTRFAQYTA